jgi:AraC-like DNA-binding protein
MKELVSSLISVPVACSREVRCSKSYRWDSLRRSNKGCVIFQYTLQGEGVFEMKGEPRRVPAGFAFISIVPEATCYYYPPKNKAPWSFSWINFYGEVSVKIWSSIRDQYGSIISIPLRSIAAHSLTDLILRVEKRGFRDRFEASEASFSFIMKMHRQLAYPQQSEKPVEIAMEYCREHRDKPIGVKELAAKTGLSREHFTRIFKQEKAISPAAFIRKEKLAVAYDLLQTTPLSLKEIAARSGFTSARHFSESFRRQYRKAPLRVRNSRV